MIDFIRNYLDHCVFLTLGLMSIIALARVIERWLHFRKVDVRNYEQLESLKLELSKGMTSIATVGTNAPYVGLLGTVFGIMLTFHDIGQSGVIDSKAVMVGLALALKATALGLFVAIPAMVFYNGLVARAEELQSQWKIAHKREH